jgi:hypothetical protein
MCFECVALRYTHSSVSGKMRPISTEQMHNKRSGKHAARGCCLHRLLRTPLSITAVLLARALLRVAASTRGLLSRSSLALAQELGPACATVAALAEEPGFAPRPRHQRPLMLGRRRADRSGLPAQGCRRCKFDVACSPSSLRG